MLTPYMKDWQQARGESMTEWDIVLVIIALVGLGATVFKPLYTNAKNTATMVTELKMFNENFKEFKKQTDKEHEDMWLDIEENKKAINDHEKRIWHIEHGGEGE